MQRDNFVTLGQATKTVDITKHEFAVALSFPGEVGGIVEQVAQELEKRIGPNSYLYDRNDVSQLARPSQDILLQPKQRNPNQDFSVRQRPLADPDRSPHGIGRTVTERGRLPTDGRTS